MPGRAFNPVGYEPELHGRLTQPPKEVMDAYAKDWTEKRAHPVCFTFDEAREHLKRGEGDVLGHYIYEMMFDIYAGIEDRVFKGAIDTHLHIYPDYAPRSIDMIELAINASKAGMDAVVCKDHFFMIFVTFSSSNSIASSLAAASAFSASFLHLGQPVPSI